MCLKIEAWLCFGPGPDQEDDYCCSTANGGSSLMMPHHHHHAGGAPAKPTTAPHYPSQDQRNGHEVPYAHHGNGRAHHHQRHRQLPVASDEEEDRKASNDARRPHATKGQEKAYAYSAGADGLLRHPATNAHYYYHQEREPAHTGEYYRYQ